MHMRGMVGRLFPRRARALVALALLASAPLGAQNVHKDERLGFKIKVPRGWEEIPLRSDEQWIVGRYRSPKTENVIDPSTGWSIEHNPELQIVAFLRKTATPSKEPAADEKDKPAGEGEAKKPAGPKVFRNYPDYMKGTYSRGHYIDKEESGTHAGLPVTKIEIKAERDTYQAEMRVFAWVYETEVADIAVQVEVL